MKSNLKKHLPLILLITGIATELGAIYTAVKQKDLIYEDFANLSGKEHSSTKEVTKSLVNHALIPVALTTTSITSYILMYSMQKNQIAGLTAALTASFGQYEILRNAFKDKYSDKEINDMEIPEFDSHLTELKSEQKGFWYINSPLYIENDNFYNRNVAEAINDELNELIDKKGYLIINDILSAFELDSTPEGKILGWDEEHWTGLIIKDVVTGQNTASTELEYELWISWPKVEIML